MNLYWGGANLQLCVVKTVKFISSQADKIPDVNRATLAARFLSTTSKFQVVPSYLSISSLNHFFMRGYQIGYDL